MSSFHVKRMAVRSLVLYATWRYTTQGMLEGQLAEPLCSRWKKTMLWEV